jgi:hypothetical protein
MGVSYDTYKKWKDGDYKAQLVTRDKAKINPSDALFSGTGMASRFAPFENFYLVSEPDPEKLKQNFGTITKSGHYSIDKNTLAQYEARYKAEKSSKPADEKVTDSLTEFKPPAGGTKSEGAPKEVSKEAPKEAPKKESKAPAAPEPGPADYFAGDDGGTGAPFSDDFESMEPKNDYDLMTERLARLAYAYNNRIRYKPPTSKEGGIVSSTGGGILGGGANTPGERWKESAETEDLKKQALNRELNKERRSADISLEQQQKLARFTAQLAIESFKKQATIQLGIDKRRWDELDKSKNAFLQEFANDMAKNLHRYIQFDLPLETAPQVTKLLYSDDPMKALTGQIFVSGTGIWQGAVRNGAVAVIDAMKAQGMGDKVPELERQLGLTEGALSKAAVETVSRAKPTNLLQNLLTPEKYYSNNKGGT